LITKDACAKVAEVKKKRKIPNKPFLPKLKQCGIK
jgi:hypothetical protein